MIKSSLLTGDLESAVDIALKCGREAEALLIASADQEIKAFAEKAGGEFQFVDLRRPAVGQGFSWGRVDDPDEDIMRDGPKPLFAIRKPLPKKSFLQRLFGR